MQCSEFLELYSDYRDGLIADLDTVRRVRRHLRECESCMRYDAVICRGVMALRAMSDLEPSLRIRPELDPRHGAGELAYRTPAGVAAALMIAAAVALLVWPRSAAPPDRPPVSGAVLAPAPPPPVVALPEPITVRLADLEVPEFGEDLQPLMQEQVSFESWIALPR